MVSFRWIACAMLLASSVGCQSWGQPGRMSSRLNSQGSRENPVIDPWVQEYGEFARNELPPESSNDPLGLRKYFVSEKARDIERNLGIVD